MDCKLQDLLRQQVVMIAIKTTQHFSQQKGFAVFTIPIHPKQSVLNSQSKCQPKKQHHLSEEKEQHSITGNLKDQVEDHPMTGKWLVTKLNKSPNTSGCSLSNWPNFMAYKCGWSDHHSRFAPLNRTSLAFMLVEVPAPPICFQNTLCWKLSWEPKKTPPQCHPPPQGIRP